MEGAGPGTGHQTIGPSTASALSISLPVGSIRSQCPQEFSSRQITWHWSPVTKGHVTFPVGSSENKLQRSHMMSSASVTPSSHDQPRHPSRLPLPGLGPQGQGLYEVRGRAGRSPRGRRSGTSPAQVKTAAPAAATGGFDVEQAPGHHT